MGLADGNDGTAPPATTAKAARTRRSRMDPAALAAAEQADQIPVGRRWGPAWTLIVVIAVPLAVWALIALALSLR
jgi:hypothetical protein